MRIKFVSGLVCMLLLCSALPALAMGTAHSSSSAGGSQSTQTSSSLGRDGWSLQWSYDYGGMGHSQFKQPVGDLDGDGVNEVVIGGYETQGHLRILSYVGGTYVEEYSYVPQGGSYNIPTGATIVDLNGDGILELVVSYGYTGADGVYVYHWDGTTMTQLDYYHGSELNFIYDVYAMDYNEDGKPEIVVSNAPWGTYNYYVIGLQWENGHLVYQTGWACPSGNGAECCMVSSGDVNNDGHDEIIADISNSASYTYGTWMLRWNLDTETFDGTPIWTDYGSNTVYGDCVGDINGDGIPEIGIGSYGGECTAWLFEWDGSSFQKVYEQTWPGGQWIIESVDIGDVDNDGCNEFCYGGGNVHVLGWNGTAYVMEHIFTEVTNMEAGMNVGDFDTDGLNELKACEIISSTGYEYIWKYTDETSPVTTCTLDGTMDGTVYITNVTVTLTATDAGSGVDVTKVKVDNESWTDYSGPILFTTDATHTVSYYSVDKMGNTESTKTTTFTIWRHPLFQVDFRGGLGLTMKITNLGISNQTMLSWSLALEGNLVLLGKGKTGQIMRLNAGESDTKKMPVFGFGKVAVKATVGTYEFNSTGMLFLFVIVGVR